MTKKMPAAFMSYVHWDDKYGQVTSLRERLSDEVQVQTGIEFAIFQDRNDIKWGQNWRERIDNSVDQVTFLIPIITPGFFNSEECRKELERFIEREKEMERNDLILPVYFVDTPRLNDPELRTTDELAEVIASRQYADWRELRFEPFTNPLVGKTLAQLAVQIRDALPQVLTQKKPFPKTPPAPDAITVTKSDRGESTLDSPTSKNEPPTVIVDPMYRGNFASIAEAIKRVDPGTRILVRPGLYQEALVIDKPLEIIGDGERAEIVVQAKGSPVILFQTTMGRVVNLTLRQIGDVNHYCVDIGQGRLELEDCDITGHNGCVAIHDGADPRLRRNRIHDSKSAAGVFVYKSGQGTLEDNDIFGNVDGVSIETTGNPTLRCNRIHDNDEDGVSVIDGGRGIVEDNDIFSNRDSGILTTGGGNPVVRNNRINNNGVYGFWVLASGAGTFENNDLAKNRLAAWSINEKSEENVKHANNKT